MTEDECLKCNVTHSLAQFITICY